MQCRTLQIGSQVVIPKLWIAKTFMPRFLGLMGRRTLPNDEAIYFPKCNSIHTFFMRFAIDVVFIDDNGVVVEVLTRLGSWRLLMPRLKAKHCIELRGGRAAEIGIAPGVKLEGGFL